MAVLTVNNLGKSFGAVDIFSEISFSVPARARIGLVGPNGVGKTTLLRIINGEEAASEGLVQLSKGVRIGYLPQQARLESQRTLWGECLSVFQGLLDQQAALRQLEEQMTEQAVEEQFMDQYGRLQLEFERLGGYTFETRIHQTLTGLGFSHEDEQRPLQQLSGGQRTRALLAKLLLEEPDLLLLDEPTNHLDISAVEWLESYLKDWPGAVFIVSHDRYFLDQVTETIFEMTPTLETYRGNYSAYLVQRAERYARRLAEFETQQEFVEKEEEYIRRNIAGQNTRQAKGRRKRLQRMLEEARITPPPSARRTLRLKLDPVVRSGNLVLRTYDLQVGYEDEGRPLFAAPDLVLKRKECAAIIGPNGAGKTTFLKTILAQIPPYGGSVELGASLQIGYFAQAHEDLHPEKTLMQEIETVMPSWRLAEIRDYLAKFLFTGEDVFKTVSLLSGGERGRLALAILGLRGANLLLLDEPTNHLDLPSQEVLQSMLGNFDGTILLVSHDRFLIDALSTQIWTVAPETGELQVFGGSYSEFKDAQAVEAQRKAAEHERERAEIRKAVNGADTAAPVKTGLSKNERLRLEQRLQAVEAQIADLEAEITRLETQLQNPPEDGGMVLRLAQAYQQAQDALAEQMHTWENVGAQLE
ncbi:MAG: ABC transporter ATP-binding protein [Chloroflexi bacterium HGW-Chloroflexi-10]|nr:MAG: ABC transporter ATP-binding protein [Chloroflexi bacterium HGW-Chloroflexi-10]